MQQAPKASLWKRLEGGRLVKHLFLLFLSTFILISGQSEASPSDEQIVQAVLKFHRTVSRKIENWHCWWKHKDRAGLSVTRLKDPEGKLLFIVPLLCFAHQHNATSIFYRVEQTGGGLHVSPLSFPLSVDGKAFSATIPLPNGAFNEDNAQIIEAHIAGYGYMPEACGSDLRYVWTGYEFVLSQIRTQPCCPQKGAGKWCDPDSDIEPNEEKPLVFTYKTKAMR